jgi:excinuclease UvrABC nuclease subunit
VNLEKLANDPGVYVFGRRFGKSFEALYVGTAKGS